MERFAGRTVVVTGGGGGIGREVCAGFAAVDELMADVNERFGGPHVLVTLAGGSLGTPKELDEIEPEHVDLVVDAIPLGRFPQLREAVDPILILASDQASYITGVVLDVSGGRFMPL